MFFPRDECRYVDVAHFVTLTFTGCKCPVFMTEWLTFLLGIEYVIPEATFEILPEEEKKVSPILVRFDTLFLGSPSQVERS